MKKEAIRLLDKLTYIIKLMPEDLRLMFRVMPIIYQLRQVNTPQIGNYLLQEHYLW